MASSKRDRQRENRNMSMGIDPRSLGGMAIPQGAMGALGPSMDEQRRHTLVQIAANSFAVGYEAPAPSTAAIIERAKAMDDFVTGKHLTESEGDEPDVPDLSKLARREEMDDAISDVAKSGLIT